MAYSATITSKTIDNTRRVINVTVELNDGISASTKIFPVRFGATLDDLKRDVQNYITELEAADASANLIAEGSLDLANVPTDDRTPEQVAQDTWLQNYQRLVTVNQLIDLGVLTGTEQKVTALRNKVKNDFQPAYIGLI